MVAMGSTADFHCLHGIRTRPIEGFAAYRERATAEIYRLLMVTELDEVPADRVKSAGLSPRVTDGVVEPQRLPSLDHRFRDAILRVQHIGAAETSERTESHVAELPGQVDGLIQIMTGADDIAQQEPQPPKMLVGRCQSGQITQPGGDRQRGFLGRSEPFPARFVMEVPPGGPGQLPGVRSVAAFGGLADDGKQDLPLVLKPLSRLRGTPHLLRYDTWVW